jgi:S-DNA-T family DNA segregation ATPase FtsK/SpoIIIE
VEECLASFGINAEVTRIQCGPVITRYTLRLPPALSLHDIVSYADDLALALAVPNVKIGAPSPSKSVAWVDATQNTVLPVRFRDVLESSTYLPANSIVLGNDAIGQPILDDIRKLAHLFIAGTTGAGKSTCINCIIASLLIGATPDELELLLIDTSRVEFVPYNGIPHLKNEVITDPSLAAGALAIISREMDQRYERLAKAGVRKMEEYNAKFPDEKLPYIVTVIDELSDLLLVAPMKVYGLLSMLVESGRAVGIHVIIGTRILSDSLVRRIAKTFPSHIAFKLTTKQESRMLVDIPGAEQLRGPGDMLYRPIGSSVIFAQGAILTNFEIQRLVGHWIRQVQIAQNSMFNVIEESERQAVDNLWYDAAKFLFDVKVTKGEAGVGSTAALQARFSIGHPRAVRLMKQLEEFGVVGPNEGVKPRNVIIETIVDLERLADRFGKPGQTDLFAE